MADDVKSWLERLGLGKYAEVFARNEIDFRALPRLTEEDLKALGLPLGARRSLQAAIERLSADRATPAPRAGPPAPPREAERRQLTVMFCDLVGSTELARRLDPEDLREVHRAYQDACKGVIERLDGHVAQYLGDGILAYFGYPRAHEDDAERAVRAGLGVVGVMGRLNARTGRTKGVELAVRVGIATGPVVVGDLMGEGAFQEGAAVGETPNLAARLQALAGRNAIVIASSTRRLAGGVFDYRDLGQHALKGFAEPVQAWEVAGESGIESRFEASRGAALTPLVGREEELDFLLSRWRRATEGEGQLVLLAGEPGIGKSRITEALLAQVAGEPRFRLRYYCSPHHTDSALHPVIRQLERAAGFRSDDPPSARLDKIEALLGRERGPTGEAVPLLAALLSVPADGRHSLPPLTSQAQKVRTFGALVEHVAALAAMEPVLMILEDAHWLDPTTAELFGLLIGRLHELRVLLVVTHRPEFASPWTGAAIEATSFTVSRLGRSQGRELVERVTAGRRLPGEVLEQILLKTDGVPLFVEEFTKAILESGALEEAGDQYALAGPLPALLVPATLHDSLMYRLDRQAAGKEVALVGSVIGREFGFPLLAAVTALPADALEPALAHLVDSELAFRRGTPPEATYTFKHALVQDAAYQSLLKGRKRELHARIARVLEERFPENAAAEPELLARHYTAADMAEPAIPHWLAAGRRALAGSSLPEAVAHLSRALELTARIGDAAHRAERELEARTALGSATAALHGWPAPEVRDVVEPACLLFERGHGGSEAFMNFWNLWAYHGCRAEHGDGLAVVDRMLRHAATRADPVLALVSSFIAAMAHLWTGDYERAAAHEQAALERYDDERDGRLAWSYNHDPRNTVLSWASNRAWALGYPDRARALSDEAVAHARRVGHPFNLCWTLGNSSAVYGYCGQYDTVCARTDELRRIAREQELGFMSGYMAPVVIGVAAAQVGKHDVAYEECARAEGVWGAIGGRFWSPMVRASMAQACVHLGRLDEAIELIDAAARQVEATGEMMFAEEVYRIAAVVHLECARDRSAAERLFQRSFECSRQHGTKSFELRTAMSLARFWDERGRRREARDLLAPVYKWFTEGFDTADLRAARALLERLT